MPCSKWLQRTYTWKHENILYRILMEYFIYINYLPFLWVFLLKLIKNQISKDEVHFAKEEQQQQQQKMPCMYILWLLVVPSHKILNQRNNKNKSNILKMSLKFYSCVESASSPYHCSESEHFVVYLFTLFLHMQIFRVLFQSNNTNCNWSERRKKQTTHTDKYGKE